MVPTHFHNIIDEITMVTEIKFDKKTLSPHFRKLNAKFKCGNSYSSHRTYPCTSVELVCI